MWIETDVGSRWWWSSGHSADGVDSNSTGNLTSDFFLVHIVAGHGWSPSSLCPRWQSIRVKIFARGSYCWNCRGGRRGGIHKLSRRSVVGVTPFLFLLSFPFFPSPTPTTDNRVSRMPAAFFQLAIITILLSPRLANAQSSTPTPVPSPVPLPTNLLVSTNPTAVPLTQIGPSEPASPTPTYASTPTSGSVPSFIPNAPPLPNRMYSNIKR